MICCTLLLWGSFPHIGYYFWNCLIILFFTLTITKYVVLQVCASQKSISWLKILLWLRLKFFMYWVHLHINYNLDLGLLWDCICSMITNWALSRPYLIYNYTLISFETRPNTLENHLRNFCDHSNCIIAHIFVYSSQLSSSDFIYPNSSDCQAKLLWPLSPYFMSQTQMIHTLWLLWFQHNIYATTPYFPENWFFKISSGLIAPSETLYLLQFTQWGYNLSFFWISLNFFFDLLPTNWLYFLLHQRKHLFHIHSEIINFITTLPLKNYLTTTIQIPAWTWQKSWKMEIINNL